MGFLNFKDSISIKFQLRGSTGNFLEQAVGRKLIKRLNFQQKSINLERKTQSLNNHFTRVLVLLNAVPRPEKTSENLRKMLDPCDF
jgi:hypothetical protein